MSKYTIVIRNPKLEEYDGGNTWKDALAQARFFEEHTPSSVSVDICTVDFTDNRFPSGLLITQLVVRKGN